MGLPTSAAQRPDLDEAEARRVVLVRAFDAHEGPLWTAADRAWATRLAAQTVAPDAPAARFVAERARHAVERLAPRSVPARRWLAGRSGPSRAIVALLLGGALALGLAAPSLGPHNHIDLLAPPVWAVIAWNLLVYAGLAVMALRSRPPSMLRRRLARGGSTAAAADPVSVAARQWAVSSAPLAARRAAVVLHLASMLLACGLIGGLYLRGLVFDIRAGWQSTFLDAATVHAVLATLLAPASALTGIAVPDAAGIEAMRVSAAAPAAVASAAPWIHLYAAMLLLSVIAPRALLAATAAWRARATQRRFPLALDDGYFRELLRRRDGGVARVQVLPHAAACSAAAALGLRALLAVPCGDEVQVQAAAPTRIGDEEQPAAPGPGTSLRVALVDLGTTPEAETHGRFVDALRRQAEGVPLLLVADEAGFRRRFVGLPARLDERRSAWRALAGSHGVAFFAADLEAADPGRDGAALAAVLAKGPSTDGGRS